MKKSIVFLCMLLAFTAMSFAQTLIEYGGESYGIKYPKGWTVEEDGENSTVKFISPEEEGMFQVIVTPTEGGSAMDLLAGWIDRTGYTNENSEDESQMSSETYGDVGADDGATGTFEPNVDGIDLFINVDVYVRGEVAYFLIAMTPVQDENDNIKKLGTIAGSFGLMD